MQIVTVNLPSAYIEAIGTLTSKGLYPSRSEAIRVALRTFLRDELELVEILMSLNEKEKEIKQKKQVTQPRKIDMRSIRAGWPSKKPEID